MNKKYLYLAASLLLMTSCSSDTDNDEAFTSPVPIEFNVSTGDEITSRSTAADNTATVNYDGTEIFAVAMTQSSAGLWTNWAAKTYKAAATSASSATSQKTSLTPVSKSNAFYWSSPSDSYDVVAWHMGYGRECPTTAPTSYTINTDQNSGSNALARNDFLFAPKTTISYSTKENNTLKAYHQNAQLHVELQLAGTDLTASDITGMTLSSVYATGTWKIDYTGSNGSYTAKSNTQDITMKHMSTYVFRAVLIPQSLSGKTLTIQNSKGYDLKYTFESDDVLAPNQYAKYTLTIGESVKLLRSTICDWQNQDYNLTANIIEI